MTLSQYITPSRKEVEERIFCEMEDLREVEASTFYLLNVSRAVGPFLDAYQSTFYNQRCLLDEILLIELVSNHKLVFNHKIGV